MSDFGSQAIAPAMPRLSQVARIAITFTAPSRTFHDIDRGNWSWWLPLVVITVATYILFSVITLRVGWQTVVDNAVRLDPRVEDRMAQVPVEQQDAISRSTRYSIEGKMLVSPVSTLAILAILSFGLCGTANVVFGGIAKYKAVLAVWFYASLPRVITSVLAAVVILVEGTPDSFNVNNPAPTNVGAFLNPLETNRVLYVLESSVDLVTIWTLALLANGLAMVARIKRSSSYLAVFGWWAIFILIRIGVAAAFN